jgi:hypothetical protein
LKDPKDEVISNTASLKNGIANYLAYGDRQYDIASLPRDYRVAEVVGTDIPAVITNQFSRNDDIHDGLSPQQRYNKNLLAQLSAVGSMSSTRGSSKHASECMEALAVHMYAHIIRVCKRATKICAARSRASASRSANSDNNSPPGGGAGVISGSQIALLEIKELKKQKQEEDAEDDEESDYEDVIVDLSNDEDEGTARGDAEGHDVESPVKRKKSKRSATTASSSSPQTASPRLDDEEDGYAFRRGDSDPQAHDSDDKENAKGVRDAYIYLMKASLNDTTLTYVERYGV